MKKIKIFTAIIFVCISVLSNAQSTKIYNTEANATVDIQNAIQQAAKEGKHVFLQIGGNWCPWCLRFHKFIEDNSELKTCLEDNYEVVLVNYDKKNHSFELFQDLGFPQRFGFPVFVILDEKGNRIHTQNSAYLEKGEGYDKEKILKFFKNWSPAALNPKSYKAN
jgi:thioredoxin-related protein